MNNIAIYTGSGGITYGSLLVALGAALFWAVGYALYTPRYGHKGAMCAFVPLSAVLSVFLARFLHWYCHSEQYESFFSAVTDYSAGSFCYPGIIAGVFLAGLIIWKFFLRESPRKLFDCLSPGMALGLAVIRLSSVFDTSCRGKITLTGVNGEVSRLPTFFIEFVLLLALSAFMLRAALNPDRKMRGYCPASGNTALNFLAWFSAAELVTDSTRYDSSFLHFNGFVSLVQIVAAVLLVGIFVYYSIWERRAERKDGKSAIHWKIRTAFILCLCVTGAAEYLVQRFGGMYVPCYTFMSLACIGMAAIDRRMFLRVAE